MVPRFLCSFVPRFLYGCADEQGLFIGSEKSCSVFCTAVPRFLYGSVSFLCIAEGSTAFVETEAGATVSQWLDDASEDPWLQTMRRCPVVAISGIATADERKKTSNQKLIGGSRVYHMRFALHFMNICIFPFSFFALILAFFPFFDFYVPSQFSLRYHVFFLFFEFLDIFFSHFFLFFCF